MKKLFRRIMAIALSAAIALGTTIYAETTPSITVSKDAVSVTIGKTTYVTVTAKDGTEKDAVTVKSANPQIATATLDGTKLTFEGVNAGVVDVTLTYAKQTAKVTVTVPASTTAPAAIKFYSDAEFKTAVTAVKDIWAGGGKVTDSEGNITTYNTKTLYTNALATVIDPDVTDNKVVKKAGKIYVGVTGSKVTAVPFDTETNKLVVDAEANNILKATYKTVKGMEGGALTLTAGKNAGAVKVWVIDVNGNGEIVRSGSFTVTVSGAASKMAVADTNDNVLKGASVAHGATAKFNIIGYLADGKTVTEDASYSVSVVAPKEGQEAIIDASYASGILTIKSLGNGTGKATVNVKCTESNKILKVNVTVINPVTAVKAAIAEDSAKTLYLKGEKVTMNVTETKTIADAPTTDKVTVYVADETEAKLAVNGTKVEYTLSKGVKAAYKNGVLTLTREDPFTPAVVYLAYTDTASGSVTVYKVATIAAIKITGGTISL